MIALHMDLCVRKPVLGMSDKVRFKPACSATETSHKIEIGLIASLAMTISTKGITKALIRLHRCAGCSAPLLFAKTGFLPSRPILHTSFKDSSKVCSLTAGLKLTLLQTGSDFQIMWLIIQCYKYEIVICLFTGR